MFVLGFYYGTKIFGRALIFIAEWYHTFQVTKIDSEYLNANVS
mgnify:CR=1 FL=1